MSNDLPKVTEEGEQLAFEPMQPDPKAWGLSTMYVFCAMLFI